MRKRIATPPISPHKNGREYPDENNTKGKMMTLSVNSNLKTVKRRKNYEFAPIKSMENSIASHEPVLKPISVSRLKNTKMDTKCNNEGLGFLNPNIVDVRTDISPEDGPSEEVIWKFSPPMVSKEQLKTTGHSSTSDDDTGHRLHDASTPIAPNKFKSILNFSHIHMDKKIHDSNLNATQNDFLRSTSIDRKNSEIIDSKECLRDIDDIINDIEGGFEPSSKSRIRDVPSSPFKVETNMNSNYSIKKTNMTTSESEMQSSVSLEADDSLINILTQQYAKPSENSEKSINDDSLMDYLETNNLDKQGSPLKSDILEGNKSLKNLDAQYDAKSSNNTIDSRSISTYQERAKCAVDRPGIIRLVIIDIKEFQINIGPRQKILQCINSKGEYSNVIVRSPWVILEFEIGDVIHIIEGTNTTNKRLLSDDRDPRTGKVNDNLLVLNPDILLSATTIGNSTECLRRSFLNTEFSQPGEISIHLTIGSIVHELVQYLLEYKLLHQNISSNIIDEKLNELINNYNIDILMNNETEQNIKAIILETQVPNIKKFISNYVSHRPNHSKVRVNGTTKFESLNINRVLDVEENIWSSIYGLKGFIDATTEVSIESNQKVIVPLEIKTGKYKSISHEAQGTIYTLLLNDRYDTPVDFHLILYTKTNEFSKHTKIINSLKHLLILRNRLTVYMKSALHEQLEDTTTSFRLPPLIQQSYCDSCYAKANCMVLNKLVENGCAEMSGLSVKEYDNLTSHINEHNITNYQAFFRKYVDLLIKEESSIRYVNKNLYLLNGQAKEEREGNCISRLTMESIDKIKDGLYRYIFFRKIQSDGLTIKNSQIAVNDSVVISDELGHFFLVVGKVTNMTFERITINAKKNIEHKISYGKSNPKRIRQNIMFRIDKNESVQNSISIGRYNLLNLFLPEINQTEYINAQGEKAHLKKSQGGFKRGRELIIENQKPSFSSKSKHYKVDELHFNKDQIKAIDLAMKSEDYTLICGMPGTGKTTVICQIIKILVEQHRKKILFTSYTHSAIDNVLLKLKGNVDFGIIRLGSLNKVHEGAAEFVPVYDRFESMNELKNSFNDAKVFATTCLGINDIMLGILKEDFDYVIVDEASQISLPIAIGPLRFGSKFILVGDHYQLPPLVKNPIAKKNGLEDSLFKILYEKHPESVTELTYQYRMCQDIMSLSNHLIYDGKLKCGNDNVARQSLVFKNWNLINQSQCWLKDILDHVRKVVFINYDNIPDIKESYQGDNIQNLGEVSIIKQIIDCMISVDCALNMNDLGIMTIYKSQLKLLQGTFQGPQYKGLEILTADRFQGRDKRCIIISMVRSNDTGKTGKLIKELSRMNVAMTRAKCKLIVVFSKKTVSRIDEMKGFIRMIEMKGWVYDLHQHDSLAI